MGHSGSCGQGESLLVAAAHRPAPGLSEVSLLSCFPLHICLSTAVSPRRRALLIGSASCRCSRQGCSTAHRLHMLVNLISYGAFQKNKTTHTHTKLFSFTVGAPSCPTGENHTKPFLLARPLTTVSPFTYSIPFLVTTPPPWLIPSSACTSPGSSSS